MTKSNLSANVFDRKSISRNLRVLSPEIYKTRAYGWNSEGLKQRLRNQARCYQYAPGDIFCQGEHEKFKNLRVSSLAQRLCEQGISM